MDANLVKSTQKKKPYTTPTLLVFGTLEEITRGGGVNFGGNPPTGQGGQNGATSQSNQNAATGQTAGSHIAAR